MSSPTPDGESLFLTKLGLPALGLFVVVLDSILVDIFEPLVDMVAIELGVHVLMGLCAAVIWFARLCLAASNGKITNAV